MPGRIAAWYTERGLRAPTTIAETAAGHRGKPRRGLRRRCRGGVARCPARPSTTVHIVGGGAQNRLLCQSVADRVGVPVLAGPVEATALGNVLIQARTHGLLTGDLESLRANVTGSALVARYTPRSRGTTATACQTTPGRDSNEAPVPQGSPIWRR